MEKQTNGWTTLYLENVTRMIGEIRLKCAVYKTMWKVELEEWE